MEARHFASVVVVDIETTGLLEESDEILQIAASSAFNDSAEIFSVFVNPVRDEISAFITGLNGISKEDGKMYARGAAVASVPLASALKMFLSYLDQQAQPVMLVAHFAEFEAKFLLPAFAKNDLLHSFLGKIAGFSDTCAAARHKYPKYRYRDLADHKLQTLYTYFVNDEDIDFHTANHDVIAVKRIMPHVMASNAEVALFALPMATLKQFY